jgi:hypothetical protein
MEMGLRPPEPSPEGAGKAAFFLPLFFLGLFAFLGEEAPLGGELAASGFDACKEEPNERTSSAWLPG